MIQVCIAGVGTIPFAKLGRGEDRDVIAEKAILLALADAGLTRLRSATQPASVARSLHGDNAASTQPDVSRDSRGNL